MHTSREGKEYQVAKESFPKGTKQIEDCADRLNKDAACRMCMQDNNRTTKPKKVGTMSQVDFGKSTTWCRSKGRRHWRTSGVCFKLQLEYPSRYQRVNILNLE